MISVTIERSALGESDLVIPGYPTAGLWLPTEGIGRPGRTWQRRTAASPFMHGTVQTGATLEQSELPLTVYAQAASAAVLETLQDEVEEAFFQLAFDLTWTENGVSRVWACDCADLSWGEFDAGMSAVHMARATLSIPCYPIAGGS